MRKEGIRGIFPPEVRTAMRKHNFMRAVAATAVVWFAAAPAHALDWNTRRLVDEFTDAQSCRVEPGGEFSRSFVRGMTGAFRTLHFYAENRNGEVRAGFMSEPLIAIPGDVQIRVDSNPLTTITAADTPLDLAPSYTMPPTPGFTPEQQAQLEQTMRSSMAIASPYRVVTGERAVALLREIVGGRDVRWRVVSINAAASGTGTVRVRGLREALTECGIDLATPAAVAP